MNIPRVGVAVLLLREGKLLLGQRLSPHGAGTWAPPGGYLEFGESLDACARRDERYDGSKASTEAELGVFDDVPGHSDSLT